MEEESSNVNTSSNRASTHSTSSSCSEVVEHDPPQPPNLFLGFGDEMGMLEIKSNLYIRLSACESTPVHVHNNEDSSSPEIALTPPSPPPTPAVRSRARLNLGAKTEAAQESQGANSKEIGGNERSSNDDKTSTPFKQISAELQIFDEVSPIIKKVASNSPSPQPVLQSQSKTSLDKEIEVTQQEPTNRNIEEIDGDERTSIDDKNDDEIAPITKTEEIEVGVDHLAPSNNATTDLETSNQEQGEEEEEVKEDKDHDSSHVSPPTDDSNNSSFEHFTVSLTPSTENDNNTHYETPGTRDKSYSFDETDRSNISQNEHKQETPSSNQFLLSPPASISRHISAPGLLDLDEIERVQIKFPPSHDSKKLSPSGFTGSSVCKKDSESISTYGDLCDGGFTASTSYQLRFLWCVHIPSNQVKVEPLNVKTPSRKFDYMIGGIRRSDNLPELWLMAKKPERRKEVFAPISRIATSPPTYEPWPIERNGQLKCEMKVSTEDGHYVKITIRFDSLGRADMFYCKMQEACCAMLFNSTSNTVSASVRQKAIEEVMSLSPSNLFCNECCCKFIGVFDLWFSFASWTMVCTKCSHWQRNYVSSAKHLWLDELSADTWNAIKATSNSFMSNHWYNSTSLLDENIDSYELLRDNTLPVLKECVAQRHIYAKYCNQKFVKKQNRLSKQSSIKSSTSSRERRDTPPNEVDSSNEINNNLSSFSLHQLVVDQSAENMKQVVNHIFKEVELDDKQREDLKLAASSSGNKHIQDVMKFVDFFTNTRKQLSEETSARFKSRPTNYVSNFFNANPNVKSVSFVYCSNEKVISKHQPQGVKLYKDDLFELIPLPREKDDTLSSSIENSTEVNNSTNNSESEGQFYLPSYSISDFYYEFLLKVAGTNAATRTIDLECEKGENYSYCGVDLMNEFLGQGFNTEVVKRPRKIGLMSVKLKRDEPYLSLGTSTTQLNSTSSSGNQGGSHSRSQSNQGQMTNSTTPAAASALSHNAAASSFTNCCAILHNFVLYLFNACPSRTPTHNQPRLPLNLLQKIDLRFVYNVSRLSSSSPTAGCVTPPPPATADQSHSTSIRSTVFYLDNHMSSDASSNNSYFNSEYLGYTLKLEYFNPHAEKNTYPILLMKFDYEEEMNSWKLLISDWINVTQSPLLHRQPMEKHHLGIFCNYAISIIIGEKLMPLTCKVENKQDWLINSPIELCSTEEREIIDNFNFKSDMPRRFSAANIPTDQSEQRLETFNTLKSPQSFLQLLIKFTKDFLMVPCRLIDELPSCSSSPAALQRAGFESSDNANKLQATHLAKLKSFISQLSLSYKQTFLEIFYYLRTLHKCATDLSITGIVNWLNNCHFCNNLFSVEDMTAMIEQFQDVFQVNNSFMNERKRQVQILSKVVPQLDNSAIRTTSFQILLICTNWADYDGANDFSTENQMEPIKFNRPEDFPNWTYGKFVKELVTDVIISNMNHTSNLKTFLLVERLNFDRHIVRILPLSEKIDEEVVPYTVLMRSNEILTAIKMLCRVDPSKSFHVVEYSKKRWDKERRLPLKKSEKKMSNATLFVGPASSCQVVKNSSTSNKSSAENVIDLSGCELYFGSLSSTSSSSSSSQKATPQWKRSLCLIGQQYFHRFSFENTQTMYSCFWSLQVAKLGPAGVYSWIPQEKLDEMPKAVIPATPVSATNTAPLVRTTVPLSTARSPLPQPFLSELQTRIPTNTNNEPIIASPRKFATEQNIYVDASPEMNIDSSLPPFAGAARQRQQIQQQIQQQFRLPAFSQDSKTRLDVNTSEQQGREATPTSNVSPSAVGSSQTTSLSGIHTFEGQPDLVQEDQTLLAATNPQLSRSMDFLHNAGTDQDNSHHRHSIARSIRKKFGITKVDKLDNYEFN